jgi:8-oxo-dGTP pyrophosphatase MutT (NUDIX family)
MKHKVLAYITRQRNGAIQLLVFDHRDFPDAGVQVPAGTAEGAEPVEEALFREVGEESGLGAEQLRLERKLAEHVSREWQTVRHVFHLSALGDLPERWTHIVQGEGEDNGLAFEYYWVNPASAPELAGDQGLWLSALTQKPT